METAEVDGTKSANAYAYPEHSVGDELEGTLQENMCQPCLTEDKKIRSCKFCTECNEYLCTYCIKAHSKFSSTKNHHLVNKKESNSTVYLRENAGTCFYHDKNLDQYCEQHDEFCCGLCLNTRHRACKDKVTITEMASKLTEDEINDVKGKTVAAVARIQDIKTARTKDLDLLDKEKEETLNALGSIKNDLHTVFERLFQNRTEIVKKNGVKFRTKLENDMQTCNEMEEGLKRMERAFEYEDKAHQFVIMKQLLKQLELVEETSNSILTKVSKKSLKLQRSQLCTRLLNQPELLFDFSDAIRLYKTTDKVEKICTLELGSCINDSLFTCIYEEQSLILPGDRSIYVYDTLRKQRRTIDVPLQVSAISFDNGTFFIAEKSKGLVVTPDGKDKVKIVLKTVEPCVGIIKSSNGFYVTVVSNTVGQLRKYTKEGALNNVLKTDGNGINVFTGRIGDVKQSKKENKIYVVDGSTGIVVVSAATFMVLKIITNLWEPKGICLVDDASFFVLYGNGDVKQTTDEGDTYSYVHRTENIGRGITRNYRSICWDGCSSIYVVHTERTTLHVMKHQLECKFEDL